MVWGLRDAQHRERLLILASKLDHCLNDLLYCRRLPGRPCGTG